MKNKQKRWRTEAAFYNKVAGKKHQGRKNRQFIRAEKPPAYPLLGALLNKLFS